MRWSICLILACCAGCTLGDSEALEAQLRLRDDRIRSLQAQLAQAERDAAAARAEASDIRSRLTDPDAVPRQEQFTAAIAVRELQFHSLLTGILDDNQIHIVLQPVDHDTDPVKLPGSLEVWLVDPANPDRHLDTWQWDPAEAADLWENAAIGPGYVIDVRSHQAKPGLELHARFTPADGRQFAAEHTL